MRPSDKPFALLVKLFTNPEAKLSVPDVKLLTAVFNPLAKLHNPAPVFDDVKLFNPEAKLFTLFIPFPTLFNPLPMPMPLPIPFPNWFNPLPNSHKLSKLPVFNQVINPELTEDKPVFNPVLTEDNPVLQLAIKLKQQK